VKIYTRTGDNGETSLRGGQRVPKYNPRIESCGTLDELVSWIGLLKYLLASHNMKDNLLNIQKRLMLCAGDLAREGIGDNSGEMRTTDEDILLLENQIDKMDKNLPPLHGFVIPGGNLNASYCNIARCVCRRAERTVVYLMSVEKINPLIPKFLNRLSDYLFVLSRYVSLVADR